MTGAPPATTIQTRGGVESASRSANSATEFGSGLRANHSSLMNGCGSICMRAASGPTPPRETPVLARNPADSAAREAGRSEEMADVNDGPRRVVARARFRAQPQRGRERHDGEQRARLISE